MNPTNKRTESALAQKLGHINLLKLGHHGSYGSNTDSYLRALSPDMAIMTGTYTYVTNSTFNGECGTRDTLLAMGERGERGERGTHYMLPDGTQAVSPSCDSSESVS